jgi:hypothetical protein
MSSVVYLHSVLGLTICKVRSGGLDRYIVNKLLLTH